MYVRRLTTLAAALSMLAACREDDSGGFVPLDNLCAAYAETACDAQQRCCEGPPALATCETRLRAACEADRDALTAQAQLRYDGERAREKLDALSAVLSACDADLAPVASLFEGGKAEGAACSEPAECASFVCESTCAAPAEAALCAL